MIVFPPYPIPVIVEGLGEAYIVYVKSNHIYDDDEVCISLLEGGQWRHVTTRQIKSWNNATYGIKKTNE